MGKPSAQFSLNFCNLRQYIRCGDLVQVFCVWGSAGERRRMNGMWFCVLVMQFRDSAALYSGSSLHALSLILSIEGFQAMLLSTGQHNPEFHNTRPLA